MHSRRNPVDPNNVNDEWADTNAGDNTAHQTEDSVASVAAGSQKAEV